MFSFSELSCPLFSLQVNTESDLLFVISCLQPTSCLSEAEELFLEFLLDVTLSITGLSGLAKLILSGLPRLVE